MIKLEDMTLLGEGGFNKTYKYGDRVVKIAKLSNGDESPEQALDTPLRSVRLWNEINPKHQAKLEELSDIGPAWSAPFISGRQSTDSENSSQIN